MILFNYKNILKTTPMTALITKHKEIFLLGVATLATVLLLTISAMSIYLLLRSESEVKVIENENVLGVSKENEEKSFWVSFLTDSPYYYPGWKRLNEISHKINDVKLQEQSKKELEKLKPY